MTNGELFKKENPNVEIKINGSCVWIYYFDGVNHYTIPTEWWNKKIGVFEDIKAEISRKANSGQWSDATVYGLQKALAIINKHMKEGE